MAYTRDIIPLNVARSSQWFHESLGSDEKKKKRKMPVREIDYSRMAFCEFYLPEKI